MAENQIPAQQAATRSYRNFSFLENNRSSQVVIDVSLSPMMHTLYRRHFDGISRAVFLLRFYCRISLGENTEHTMTKVMREFISDVKDDLQNKVETADKIILNEKLRYKPAAQNTYHAIIIDPIALQFLETLKIAGLFEEKLSALWLAGLINEGEFKNSLREIYSEIRKIQNGLRSVSLEAQNRMRNRQSNNEVPQTQPDNKQLELAGEKP